MVGLVQCSAVQCSAVQLSTRTVALCTVYSVHSPVYWTVQDIDNQLYWQLISLVEVNYTDKNKRHLTSTLNASVSSY